MNLCFARRSRGLLSVLLIAGLDSIGFAQISFTSGETAVEPIEVELIDLDGDGDGDLVVYASNSTAAYGAPRAALRSFPLRATSSFPGRRGSL